MFHFPMEVPRRVEGPVGQDIRVGLLLECGKYARLDVFFETVVANIVGFRDITRFRLKAAVKLCHHCAVPWYFSSEQSIRCGDNHPWCGLYVLQAGGRATVD